MTAALLDVAGVYKSLGDAGSPTPILGGISLQAKPGEFVSLVGPSGCGKTTLLLTLAGLLPPDSGNVHFAGSVVREPPPGVAVVFQDYSRSLFPWRKNISNVMFGMRRLPGLSLREKEARARDLLAHVGLRGFESYYPWQISGGMQQRVAIARGLASQSRMLLLDEPLASVDAQTRSEMQDLLLLLAAEYKQTCVLVTHDIDEAVYVADRVIVLSQRPTKVLREFQVDIPKPRDQLTTRSSPDYLRLRGEILLIIQSLPKAGLETTH